MKLFTKPRIIGIILILTGIMTWMTGTAGTYAFVIAGIILLIAPTKYADHVFDLFIESFSNWKTIIITALYDAIFWLLVFGSAYFLKWQLEIKAASAQAVTTLTQEGLQNPEILTQNNATLQGFIWFILLGAILVLLFCFLAYTILRGLDWTSIAKQKFNKNFFVKFLGLNAGWWAVWLPIFLVILLGAKQNPNVQQVLVFIFFLAMYFTPIVHTLFMKKHLIGSSIGNGLAYGIAKIHRFIIPYTFALVLYVILYQAFKLAVNTIWMKAAAMLFVVLFFAWLRVYLYEVIREL